MISGEVTYSLTSAEHDILLELSNDPSYNTVSNPSLKHLIKVSKRLSQIHSHKFKEISHIFHRMICGTQPILITLNNLPESDHHIRIELILANLFGHPIRFEGEGDYVMELQCKDSTSERPSYMNSREFTFHTDMSYVENPPNFMMLYCIKPSSNYGGHSIFADVNEAVKKLSSKTISHLSTDQYFVQPPPHYNGPIGAKYFPILAYDNKLSQWNCRIRKDGLRSETKFGLQAAMELYRAFDSIKYEIKLPKNSAVFMNNYAIVHGRTAFLTGDKGHIDRIYLGTDDEQNV